MTWLLEIPVVPSAWTRSSTERVEFPWMSAVSAFSVIRGGSRKPGKDDPGPQPGEPRLHDPGPDASVTGSVAV